jgi:DNA-binding response OmpR family regulator
MSSGTPKKGLGPYRMAPSRPKLPIVKRSKILIVEDELELREIMLQTLGDTHDCLFALTETEIFEQAKESDTAIVSWLTPMLDVRKIVTECSRYTPVLVTASDRSDLPADLLTTVTLLEKPFRLDDLVQKAAESVQRKASEFFIGSLVFSNASPGMGAGKIVDRTGDQIWVTFGNSSKPSLVRREHLRLATKTKA